MALARVGVGSWEKMFVEKSSFAIDSPDEVRGIPYEAIRQRKAGNSFLGNTNTGSRRSIGRRVNFGSGVVSQWL